MDPGAPSAAGTGQRQPAGPDGLPIADIRDLHYGYVAGSPVLRGLDLIISPGEICAIVGANGSGKSTLARILCGLQGGLTADRALVCGGDLTQEKGRRDARRHAGALFQDPESQIIGATVEDDVAFALENRGWEPVRMAARVDEMLGRFGLEGLRSREPHELSGGQKQGVALAGVLALPRRLLVLDEPTAMLDADGRRDVLEALPRLRQQDPAMAIVLITQEMDELELADRAVALAGGGIAYDGKPDALLADAELMRRLGLEPPVAARIAQFLAAAGRRFDPPPLTVAALAHSLLTERGRALRPESAAGAGAARPLSANAQRADATPVHISRDVTAAGAPRISCSGLRFAYRDGDRGVPAVQDIDLELPPGSATALLGPSGAGKSTLLLLLRGLLRPDAGHVLVEGGGEHAGHGTAVQHVGIVFQRAELQLFAQSAWDDVAFGPRRLGATEAEVNKAVAEAMDLVGLPAVEFRERHPHALSTGEQRRLGLAGVLAMRPGALLLDEPFVSMDPAGRRDLLNVLKELRDRGITLLLATHDSEAALALCSRRVIMDGGRVVADGPWDFGGRGLEALEAHGIQVPPTVDLWRRLGRPLDEAPREPVQAAEALS